FHHRLVNRPFSDTSMYLRILHARRALLFDAGEVGGLSPGDIMKISELFISHTHIDHFIGFDTILRVLLKRPAPLNVYGPPGIIEAVEHKLGGYTWNRIRDYPVKLDVFSIEGQYLRHGRFYAENGFMLEEMGNSELGEVLVKEDDFSVRSIMLDHDMPCAAYSVEEPVYVNVIKTALEAMGLMVGPWLRDLKSAVRRGEPDGFELLAGSKIICLGDLRGAISTRERQKVVYVTDANPTKDNIDKITEFSHGATTLYCEACFLEADRDRAFERNHLTGVMAGMIAQAAGAQKLVPMHLSNRYLGASRTPADEALYVFEKGKMR
ncbi:MAG: hypothetical protein KAR83_09710, partial [Thermodesulfovibrionales bacterium]|nr:hypothetical protein [Thermodesulfovibrionales bacterium]